MFVPTANSSLMLPIESKLSDDSFVIPSTLFSFSSCSRTISCSTSCGEAPGQRVSTVNVGVSTSGVSCIGIENPAMVPNNISSNIATETLTGFLTKVSTSDIQRLNFVVLDGNSARRAAH